MLSQGSTPGRAVLKWEPLIILTCMALFSRLTLLKNAKAKEGNWAIGTPWLAVTALKNFAPFSPQITPQLTTQVVGTQPVAEACAQTPGSAPFPGIISLWPLVWSFSSLRGLLSPALAVH